MAEETALGGLRVVDLSFGPAGGLAGMVLADFGAEVIKIEPPGGDPYRRHGSAPFWLRGKQSAVLDLGSGEDKGQLDRLLDGADVLLLGLSPAALERLGLDVTAIRGRRPALIVTRISGFGQAGPYRDYAGHEGVVAAKSGRMMSFAGQGRREGPVFAAVQVGTYAAAMAAVHGTLAALLVRDRTGRGQVVDTSILQGMLPYDLAGLATRQLTRMYPEQFPADPLAAYNRQPTLQYQPVLAADGRWLQLGNLIEHLFHSFLAAADLGEIYADPRFANAPHLEPDEREALRDVILTRMLERPADAWMERFIADGNVAAEPVVDTQRSLAHPQLRHNGDVREVTTRGHGRMLQLGPIAAMAETPARVRFDAPAIDEHDPDLIGRWSTLRPAHRTPDGGHEDIGAAPLAGVTVVELATIIAAPYACALLGDLGARVIKIETPPDGDPLRSLGNGVSTFKTTASKESICLDLKQPEGRAVAQAIIETADVLIHNFRPGVPERLGFGFEAMRQRNPGLVYVSAMGYGTTGPYARRPSAHPIPGAAMGGALWQSGSGWPGPVESIEQIREAARWFTRANEVNPDPTTSMAIATAALLGLAARRRTGRGQAVELNMFIANGYANWDDALWYEGKPDRPLVDPDLHGTSALYRLYRAGEGWVFLACPTDAEWSALCTAAGWGDLAADPRFATRAARDANDEALVACLAPRFLECDADAWESLLTAAGVGCVRADGPPPGGFWEEDRHVAANGFTSPVEHPLWGAMSRHGPVVTFSESRVTPGSGTIAGQHTRAILAELGYAPGAIDDLLARGVAAARDAAPERYTTVDAR